VELLNWFKKPLKWWAGLALIVVGTIFVRGVEGCEYCVPMGALLTFTGIAMALFFGKVKTDEEKNKDDSVDH